MILKESNGRIQLCFTNHKTDNNSDYVVHDTITLSATHCPLRLGSYVEIPLSDDVYYS